MSGHDAEFNGMVSLTDQNAAFVAELLESLSDNAHHELCERLTTMMGSADPVEAVIAMLAGLYVTRHEIEMREAEVE